MVTSKEIEYILYRSCIQGTGCHLDESMAFNRLGKKRRSHFTDQSINEQTYSTFTNKRDNGRVGRNWNKGVSITMPGLPVCPKNCRKA